MQGEITTLNVKQLTFLLKEPTQEKVRDRMVSAYIREHPEEEDKVHNYSKGYGDPFPEEMSIEMLSRRMGIPHLQYAVNDIYHKYLDRHITRSFIYNYPVKAIETEIKRFKALDEPPQLVEVAIPSVIASLLKEETIDKIHAVWEERYGKYGFFKIKETYARQLES